VDLVLKIKVAPLSPKSTVDPSTLYSYKVHVPVSFPIVLDFSQDERKNKTKLKKIICFYILTII
jgi:hypothetical protein